MRIKKVAELKEKRNIRLVIMIFKGMLFLFVYRVRTKKNSKHSLKVDE